MDQKLTIAIGVTGGIAAYKVCDLVSRLNKKGFNVEVVMTESATHFVNPLTFSTLSNNPVRLEMFNMKTGDNVQHISIARRADLMVIVPATANIIGKVACGIADDLLSTTIMATHAPVIFCPAMNDGMWENKIVQENIERLRGRGYQFIDPEDGYLACGTSGKGRLASIDVIEDMILSALVTNKDLTGYDVLVTAGPTREAIDPVRYISNLSSGKMGFAIARAARDRGANVHLVCGPVNIPMPVGINVYPVESANEMEEQVLKLFPKVDAVVKAAAVADYRPINCAKNKMKKSDEEMSLELVRNPDILKVLGQKKEHQVLVGFAAETNDLEKYAMDKLAKKNLDMIVANDVTKSGAGFNVDTNIVTIYASDGSVDKLPMLYKEEIANIIWDKVFPLLANRKGGK